MAPPLPSLLFLSLVTARLFNAFDIISYPFLLRVVAHLQFFGKDKSKISSPVLFLPVLASRSSITTFLNRGLLSSKRENLVPEEEARVHSIYIYIYIYVRSISLYLDFEARMVAER